MDGGAARSASQRCTGQQRYTPEGDAAQMLKPLREGMSCGPQRRERAVAWHSKMKGERQRETGLARERLEEEEEKEDGNAGETRVRACAFRAALYSRSPSPGVPPQTVWGIPSMCCETR